MHSTTYQASILGTGDTTVGPGREMVHWVQAQAVEQEQQTQASKTLELITGIFRGFL